VKPVAAMTSSASTDISAPPSDRVHRTRKPAPIRSIRLIEALSMNTPPPRFWSSTGWM
jgi:hypothetical protein